MTRDVPQNRPQENLKAWHRGSGGLTRVFTINGRILPKQKSAFTGKLSQPPCMSHSEKHCLLQCIYDSSDIQALLNLSLRTMSTRWREVSDVWRSPFLAVFEKGLSGIIRAMAHVDRWNIWDNSSMPRSSWDTEIGFFRWTSVGCRACTRGSSIPLLRKFQSTIEDSSVIWCTALYQGPVLMPLNFRP